MEVSEELEGAVLEIDKAWQGVHCVLCGEVEPGPSFLSEVVLGGTEVGEHVSFGAAKVLENGRSAPANWQVKSEMPPLAATALVGEVVE